MRYEFDDTQWTSVIFRPSLWWRIRALFKPPEIIVCWGQDRYMTSGFGGEEYLAAGGVPISMRSRAEHGARYSYTDAMLISEALRAALNYINHVGANHTMRGQPHPQAWLVDKLEAAIQADNKRNDATSATAIIQSDDGTEGNRG
jgi:hypothetical protein